MLWVLSPSIPFVLRGHGQHVIVDIRRAAVAFVLHPDQGDAILNNVSTHLYIARTAIYAVQTFIGDVFIVRSVELCHVR